MKIVSVNYTYKSPSEFTDKEFETFVKYMQRGYPLSNSIMQDINNDVKEECHEGLRSIGYKFQCDDISFPYYHSQEYSNLEYLGEMPDDFEVSDRVSIGIYSVDYGKKFTVSADIVENIILKIYSSPDEYDLNYNDTVNIGYFYNTSEFKKYYELTSQEMNTISSYVYRFVSKLKDDYAPFKEDVDRIIKVYYDTTSFKSDTFKEYISRYSNLGIYFDEDGNIVKYDWNYEE